MLRKLNFKELEWLKKMLDADFLGNSELLEQINNAKVTPNYNKYFISLKFHIDANIVGFPYKVRNPIEMRAYQKNAVPVVLLIHVINNYIDELEIFNADSSRVSSNFTIDNVERVINLKLII